MIRVLIVDDERPARDGLKLRLEKAAGFEVVGEAASGRAAVAAIARHEPDLVFLDVRMPDMNGFEVLRRIAPNKRPKVIFVTAYDHHALEAFEFHALDYVMKPIVAKRLDAALERAKQEHAQKLATKTIEELAAALRGDPTIPRTPLRSEGAPTRGEATLDRLTLRDGHKLRIVPVEAIQRVESCGNYVTIHTQGKELLHRVTLSWLERRLPKRAFARIHRATIVNVTEVAEIRRSSHGDGEVVLKDGTVLRMSRRYRDALL